MVLSRNVADSRMRGMALASMLPNSGQERLHALLLVGAKRKFVMPLPQSSQNLSMFVPLTRRSNGAREWQWRGLHTALSASRRLAFMNLVEHGSLSYLYSECQHVVHAPDSDDLSKLFSGRLQHCIPIDAVQAVMLYRNLTA